jgi:uncharacterized damage-inducible protein DinB
MNVREFFKHWDEVRTNLFRALDLLSDDQLDFVPREGLWSLGEVARHIANAEEGWFRFGIAREYDEWPAAYPAADYPTVESVKTLLTEVHARTLSYLDTLSMADLEKKIKAPWGDDFALFWIIWHVIDHELHHRGEIYLMLGLMGMEAPEI